MKKIRFTLTDEQVQALLSNRISQMIPVVAEISRQYMVAQLKTANDADKTRRFNK
jgi:hypothetical protein